MNLLIRRQFFNERRKKKPIYQNFQKFFIEIENKLFIEILFHIFVNKIKSSHHDNQ